MCLIQVHISHPCDKEKQLRSKCTYIYEEKKTQTWCLCMFTKGSNVVRIFLLKQEYFKNRGVLLHKFFKIIFWSSKSLGCLKKIIKNNNKTQNCIPFDILSKKHGPHLDFKPCVFMPRLNLIFKRSESFHEKITY